MIVKQIKKIAVCDPKEFLKQSIWHFSDDDLAYFSLAEKKNLANKLMKPTLNRWNTYLKSNPNFCNELNSRKDINVCFVEREVLN